LALGNHDNHERFRQVIKENCDERRRTQAGRLDKKLGVNWYVLDSLKHPVHPAAWPEQLGAC